MKTVVKQVVGIDEAGRGCWAGPLVAAAVLMFSPIDGLKDSKVLSAKQRKALANIIRVEAVFGVGIVDNEEIDRIGLTAATSKAMGLALSAISESYEQVIIDGNFNYLPDVGGVITEIKADSKYPCVSAASIMAKVARDELMYQAAIDHPQYGFEKHVGYGTALHLARLKAHGPCKLHRLSYKPIRTVTEARDVVV